MAQTDPNQAWRAEASIGTDRAKGIKGRLILDLLRGAWKWDHKLSKLLGFGLFFLSKLTRIPAIQRYSATHPVYAYILLTTRCSLNCEDCCFADVINNPTITKTDFSLQEIERIYEKKGFRNIGRVVLFGGEPTMCREHVDIIRFLRSKGIVVQLTTNGLHLSENTLRRLAEADLNMLNITIYDKTEAGKLRNVDKLRRAFDYIRDGVFPVDRVGLCFHSTNASDYEFAYSFAREVSAQHLLLNTTYFSDANAGFASKVEIGGSFAEAYSELCEQIEKDGRINLYRPELDVKHPKACPFVETGLTFGPTGAVSPCCLVTPDEKKYGSVDDLGKLMRFKGAFVDGRVPNFCNSCPVLGTKYV